MYLKCLNTAPIILSPALKFNKLNPHNNRGAYMEEERLMARKHKHPSPHT
ncbi:8051_t:CDS:2 [Diversispora eburnea]|uniref:8051_t:CDS:1 n=1 Tax=Diversispora eburnea TaxID=1213867 RepID=A0A9N8V509_9GLOM|nr:8051_t:CDS:2 [Diversispora eburnea]